MSFFGYFGKDPRDFFLDFNPEKSKWRVVTWNFDLGTNLKRKWTVEIHGKKRQLIQWGTRTSTEVCFYEDEKLLRKKKIDSNSSELGPLMNLAIHSTLKYGLEINRDFMLTPVSGVTTLDMQSEARSLQWIEASFGTLRKALENVKNNPDLILTAACFSGQVPESGEEVLRVIVFNLDIFYYLRPDSTLQIVVFDDKNLGHGQSKTPTFQQIIKVTKPQFYDEIIKLLHYVAVVGEIR
jgi:hypothetical protein